MRTAFPHQIEIRAQRQGRLIAITWTLGEQFIDNALELHRCVRCELTQWHVGLLPDQSHHFIL